MKPLSLPPPIPSSKYKVDHIVYMSNYLFLYLAGFLFDYPSTVLNLLSLIIGSLSEHNEKKFQEATNNLQNNGDCTLAHYTQVP